MKESVSVVCICMYERDSRVCSPIAAAAARRHARRAIARPPYERARGTGLACSWGGMARLLVETNARNATHLAYDGVDINSRLAGAVGRGQGNGAVVCDHLGQDVEDRLGNGSVVDVDQVTGDRVDLEAPVESQSSFDDLRGYFEKALSAHVRCLRRTRRE